jgi:hypothetical protein
MERLQGVDTVMVTAREHPLAQFKGAHDDVSRALGHFVSQTTRRKITLSMRVSR